MKNIEYIDTKENLDVLCTRIRQASWIAVDTEFLREKTYYPKFCLLQLATPEWVACVDPLAFEHIEPVFDALNNPDITKVFHSCRQDLEIFYHLTGNVPGPIFDTQIAAPLLGFQDNPGYAMLVSNMLNVNLNKAHTRTDWSVRPLSHDQIEYAADDVIYLCKIYQKIIEQLKELGRLDWLAEDFKTLSLPDAYCIKPQDAWLKIKNKNKLTGRQLSILQLLSEWREQISQQEDRPRNWLMRDDLIIELAKLQPENITQLSRIRGINERTIKRYGEKICRLVKQAKQRSPIKLQEKKTVFKKTLQQEAVIDVLSAIVRIRAEQNSINQSLLANRKDLELFLLGNQTSKLMQGWRYSMIGKELQAVLQGDCMLTITPQGIEIK